MLGRAGRHRTGPRIRILAAMTQPMQKAAEVAEEVEARGGMTAATQVHTTATTLLQHQRPQARHQQLLLRRHR